MYCYGLAQIPAGVMADIFGARRVILISIILCICGIALFATAQGLTQAMCGRALLGFGSAGAFLTVNKIGAAWFPPGRRAFVFGITMTAGTIGALNGGAPLAALSHAMGWREALLTLCLVGGCIFLVNSIWLKASPKGDIQSETIVLRDLWRQLKKTLKNVHVLIAALAAVGIYLAIAVLADLWGVAYMMQFYSIDKSTAAQCTSLLYVGLCVGALVISWWSDKTHQRKRLIVAALVCNVISLTAFLYMPNLSLLGACALLFFIGFCTGAEMVCFAYATEIVPHAMMGTVTGYINGLVTLGGAFIQQQVGKILDEVWCGQCTTQGLHLYGVTEYRYALSLSIGVIVFTTFVALFLQDYKKKSA
jgi:MFS family permease